VRVGTTMHNVFVYFPHPTTHPSSANPTKSPRHTSHKVVKAICIIICSMLD